MATIEHPSGLRITVPEGLSLALDEPIARSSRSTRRKPNVVPMPGSGASTVGAGESRAIATALAGQDLVLVARLPFEPSPVKRGAVRAAAAPGPKDLSVEIDLDSDEGAVVLLEQDGVYSWHCDAVEEAVPHAAVVRRRGRGPDRRRMRFSLPLGGKSTEEARKRGWLSDFVVGRVQAFVFKFAGRFLLRRGTAFLERKVRTGVVVMGKNDPSGWKEVDDLSTVKLPDDRPARILLFVHGTFSSTKGGFAALGATPWGRELLSAARANYDAVLGFDHPTLSVDPLANATALLRALEGRQWAQPATIDAIGHSRGGIVLRSLIEHLLPAASLPVRVERVVFVGAVNGGTKLAEPKNWRSLIDIYTNIAAAACRAIGMFPQATFAAAMIEEMLKSVGVLAKVLVEQALTEQVLPGLAAMQPSGPFINELNQTQAGQPTAASSRYYAVTSEFRATLALDSLEGLPRRLLLALADGAVDRLMGVANDLVVDTPSMTHIDPQSGTFIKDTLDFGKNGVVYHTCYFLQPQVTSALARWLELKPRRVASPTGLRRLVRGGAALPFDIPARVSTDVLVMPAEDTERETLAQIRRRKTRYVVVERMWEGQQLHYAFATEEVLDAIRARPGVTLQDALGVHETDASLVGEVNRLPQPHSDARRPSSRRIVALDGGRVVGVAEASVVPVSLADLVRQAQPVKARQGGVRGRAPSFSIDEPARGVGREHSHLPRSVNERTGRGGPGAEVLCHFLAEMDDAVVVGETTAVDVTLSREIIGAARAVAAAGKATANTDRKLIVELVPKKNFIVTGSTREEIDIPAPGTPIQLVFDVTGTDEGDGEVLVRIRQGAQPLASLLLRSTIHRQRTRPSARRSQDASVLEAPQGPQPLHQLTITEIERGGQKLYHYVLDSPSLDWKDIYESRPLTGNREDFIKGVYADIEDRYLSNNTNHAQFQQELRELGAGLWDELFPSELQAALWKRRDAIKSILVFSEEPFIPWELVHLKPPGKGLPRQTLFFGQMGLVRWLHNVGWPTTSLRARAGRCRYVIPRYPHPDDELPGAAEEARFLEERFDATAVVPHAQPVRKLLGVPGAFDFLHFACHGLADSGDIAHAELLLQGTVESGNYIRERFRASVIENLSGLVGKDGVRPVVTLNACQTGRAGYKMTSIGGFSRAFLKQGAGMFIAAMWSVGDEPARTFTETLYERLLAKDTLAEATIVAREASRRAKEATWLAYTVYGHPDAKLDR